MRMITLKKLLLYKMMLLLVATSGCVTMSRGYGKFVADESVAQRFQKYQIDPDMNYYYSGSELYPNVIMGLKKEYSLDNNLWRPLKSDPELFKTNIYNMVYTASNYSRQLYGFVMKSPAGRTLGVWFSPLDVQMRVKMGKNNKVVVFTPDQQPDVNEDDFGERRPRLMRLR